MIDGLAVSRRSLHKYYTWCLMIFIVSLILCGRLPILEGPMFISIVGSVLISIKLQRMQVSGQYYWVIWESQRKKIGGINPAEWL